MNLPDNWEWGSNQDKQEYSYTEWKHMEDAGAVCLPTAGYRDEGEDEIKSTGLNGYYWTSSSEESPCAFCYVVEGYRGFVGRDYELRNSAYSVRLVTES